MGQAFAMQSVGLLTAIFSQADLGSQCDTVDVIVKNFAGLNCHNVKKCNRLLLQIMGSKQTIQRAAFSIMVSKGNRMQNRVQTSHCLSCLSQEIASVVT